MIDTQAISLNRTELNNPFNAENPKTDIDRREKLRNQNLEIYSYGISEDNYKKVLELDANLNQLNNSIDPTNETDLKKMEKITKLFSLISLDRGLGKDQKIQVNGESQVEPACLMPKRNKLLAQVRNVFNRRLLKSNQEDFLNESKKQIQSLKTSVFRYGGDEFCILGKDEHGELKLYMLDVANLKSSDNASAGNYYLTSIGNIIQSELTKLSEGGTDIINDQVISQLVNQINSTGREVPTKSSPDNQEVIMKQMSVTCHTDELAIPKIESEKFKIWLNGIYRGEVLSLDQCKFQAIEESNKSPNNPNSESEKQEFIRRTPEQKKTYVKESLKFLSGAFQDFDELCDKYNKDDESVNLAFYTEIYETMYHSLFDDLNIDRTVNEMINLGEVYATIAMDFKLKPMNQNHALGDQILQTACKKFMNHLFQEETLRPELRQYISINQTACCPYIVIKRDYDLLLKKNPKTPQETQIVEQISTALANAENFKGFDYKLDNGQMLHFQATAISDIGLDNLGINREIQAKKYSEITKGNDINNFDGGILSRNMIEVADNWLLENLDGWLSLPTHQLENYLKWISLDPEYLENFMANKANPPITDLHDPRLLQLFGNSEQIFMEWKLWNSPVGEGLKEGKVLKSLKNNRVSDYGKKTLTLMEKDILTKKDSKYNENNENNKNNQNLKLIKTFLESRVNVVV